MVSLNPWSETGCLLLTIVVIFYAFVLKKNATKIVGYFVINARRDLRSGLLRFSSHERSKWPDTVFIEHNGDRTEKVTACLVLLNSYKARGKKKTILVQHPPLTASALQLLVYTTACGALSPHIPPHAC